MWRSVTVLLFLSLAATAYAERLHIQVLGQPGTDVARGIDLGTAEMTQTARLLRSELTVSPATASRGVRVAGRIATSVPVSTPPTSVPIVGVADAGAGTGRCDFRIHAEGTGGARSVAWLPSLDKYGASDLNERFRKRFNAPMSAAAWTGWFAVKALVESALRTGRKTDLCTALTTVRLDGHKGEPLFFDPRTRELQQPMYAYVSNEIAETVSVIDLSRDAVVRTMKVDGRPRGIEAAGSELYVALSDTNREQRSQRDGILKLDATTGKVLTRYESGTDPERFVLSKDRRRLFAANEDAGTATVTDLASNKVRATLVVGVEPEGVAISPDGRWVYVTAETSNTVSVIDTTTLKVVSSMLVDPRPRDAAFSPDGKRAYVTAEIGGTVAVIDVRRHKVIDTLTLPAPAKPVGVAVAPDGKTVYVATGHGNSVVVIDAAQLKIVANVPVGRRPWGVAVSPDGRRLYTANGVSGDVSVVDTGARRELKRISTGAGAWGVAITATSTPRPRGTSGPSKAR
jgi:PQQ-dependent catabolism-associated beta-propeller protein